MHTVVELPSGGSGGGPTALIARSEGCEQDDACFLIETYRICGVAAIKLVASGEGEGGNAGRLRGRRGSGSQDAGGGCQALQRNGSLTGTLASDRLR